MSTESEFALVVLEDRLTRDWMEPTGSGTRDSAFTEDGPEPGEPVHSGSPTALDEWRPLPSQRQTRGIDVRAIQGGYPGRGEGASCAFRLSSQDEDDDFRGWDEPVHLVNLSCPDANMYDPTAPWAQFDLAANPNSGELYITASSGVVGEDAASVTWGYYPPTGRWRAFTIDWAAQASGLSSPLAVDWDQESQRFAIWSGGTSARENLFVQYVTSDQWFESAGALSSRGWLRDSALTASSTTKLWVTSKVGQDWLMLWTASNGSGTTHQLRSTDRGARWELVDSAALDSSNDLYGCLEIPTGFGVFYRNSSGFPAFKVIASASTYIDNSDNEVVVSDTEQCRNILVAKDADDVLYALWTDDTVGQRGVVHMARSLTFGRSWERYQDRVTLMGEGNTTPTLDLVRAIFAGGQLHVLVRVNGEGLQLASFGGWSNVEHGARTGSSQMGRRWRCGFGGQDQPIPRDEPVAFLWDALFPATKGWTQIGAGVAVGHEYRGYLMNQSSSGPMYFQSASGGAVRRERSLAFAVIDVDEAPSKAAVESRTYSQGIRVRAADNGGGPTGAAGLEVNLFSDGFIVTSQQSTAILANIDADLVSDVLHLRVAVEGILTAEFRGAVWYRLESGDDPSTWILAWEGALLNAGLGAGGVMEWGVFGSDQSSRVYYRALGCTWGNWHRGLTTVGEIYDTSVEGPVGLQYGKVLPSRTRYPCPGLNVPQARTLLGYLRGTGFAAASDLVVIEPRYEFSLDNLFPLSSPSPRRLWRGTDTSEVALSWDWEQFANGSNDTRWHGNVLALVVLGTVAPRLWTLEYYSGAAWVVIGTLDLALGTGLRHNRTGVAVYPGAGTAEIDRYIHEGELVGGYVVDTVSGDAERIVRNSAGYWTGDATKQRIRLEVEGESIGADNSGTEIIAPGGVAIFDAPNLGFYRYVRVRAAPGQTVPDDQYQAGVVGVGRVVGIGAEPGWGWRRTLELTRTTTRREDMLLEVRPTGPAREVLTYEWPDGIVVRELNSLANRACDPMVIGASGPVGTREDAHSVVTQLLAGVMDQGRVPCVMIPQVPALGGTLTDPFRFVYGRVRTDSIGITGLYGREGVDETVRLDSLSVEAIK